MKKLVPQYFFLLLVVLVTLAFFRLIGAFFISVFWATILAILFTGRYEKIKSRITNNPSLASGLTLVYLFILVVAPLTAVSVAVVSQASAIVETINEENIAIKDKVANLQEQVAIENNAFAKLGISAQQIKDKISELYANGTHAIATYAIRLSQNVFGLLFSLVLTFYILFFFLRDGKLLINELLWVFPMHDKEERELLSRFESVARATVKGSLMVAFIQGVIGGLAFGVLGIHAAFLWGVLMIIASLLPFGCALVWAPWAIVLMLEGRIGQGVILAVVGVGVIGVIDNFLRPRLVGKDTKLPDYLVLLSTLGGLAWFGITGFVIGPMIAALFVTFWQMMGKEYGNPRQEPNFKQEGR
ncbi:MAG: AI-2E family transporter [Phaeodactylibacter sp.]|nr:AI-2E family transporter [Phaeodactylibacter sp.]MCB9300316.1 AI-2E family transporter [Lewinellaceae bacterium]